jgi:hypothetical protein
VTGAFSVGLWVVFDHQFNDAQSFIADDSFEVKDGFTAEELANLKVDFQTESSTLLNHFIVCALFGLFTFGAITTSIICYFW